jgi:hypothetical protein
MHRWGINIGFKSFFQAAHSDQITFAHYLILQEALAAKTDPELKNMLQDAVMITAHNRLYGVKCSSASRYYIFMLSYFLSFNKY